MRLFQALLNAANSSLRNLRSILDDVTGNIINDSRRK